MLRGHRGRPYALDEEPLARPRLVRLPANPSPTLPWPGMAGLCLAGMAATTRAEAEREWREALSPSATHTYQVIVKTVAAPEECADDLEDRGLKTR